jgi:hypothetical protein
MLVREQNCILPDLSQGFPMSYLGDREVGKPLQDQELITPAAWRGMVGLIQSSLRTARFAEDFPDRSCIDQGMSAAITGCNEEQFYSRLNGDHSEIEVPITTDVVPTTLQALEVVEFCHRHVSLPISPNPHSHYSHNHYLHFSRNRGQEEFAKEVNTILARNRLAYELQSNGEVRRLIPPVLLEVLVSAEFTSEDKELNRLLESARRQFSSPDFRTRYDGLKDLWDAFERLKTLEPPQSDKKKSSANLIGRVSKEPKVQDMLDKEMRVELSEFGNGFFIRHANAAQVSLQTSEEIDYLFHRLFAIVRLLLRSTGRGN